MVETYTPVVLVVVAIAMVTGGVVGYGVSDIGSDFGVEKVEQPHEDVEVTYEPLIDPSAFGHPVVMLMVVVAGSVVVFATQLQRDRSE